MASLVDLDTLVGFGKVADAALAKVVKAVMQANNWTITGACKFNKGPVGYTLHVNEAIVAKVAKTGGTAIPAMSGSTPGSGTVTLYDLDTTLTAAGTDTAVNIAPETVTANTWIVVNRVDGKWLVIYEICAI